jgi:uncharacterized protein YdeI (BOF family)
MVLLTEQYPDARVRRWVVSQLEFLADDELKSLLGQLVTTINLDKFEFIEVSTYRFKH